MPVKFKSFFYQWINTVAGVILASYLVGGIHVQGVAYLAIAALLLGFLNAWVRPALIILSLPVMIFSLGLFTLIINAALLFLAGWLLKPGFEVVNFSSAFWGALIIAITGGLLNFLTGTGNLLIKFHRATRPPGPPPSKGGGDGGGPVIDV